MHPYYVIRMLGGLLYLAGALIMAFNLWMTVTRGVEERPAAAPPPPRWPREGAQSMKLFGIEHKKIETNLILMGVLTLITVSIGGLAQIVPLFTVATTIERVEGMRPYTPLELMGRNIYIREGCYTCHSQMVRPSATSWNATATTASRRKACTTTPSNGARSGRGRTSRGSAGAIRMTGRRRICAARARWCRKA